MIEITSWHVHAQSASNQTPQESQRNLLNEQTIRNVNEFTWKNAISITLQTSYEIMRWLRELNDALFFSRRVNQIKQQWKKYIIFVWARELWNRKLTLKFLASRRRRFVSPCEYQASIFSVSIDDVLAGEKLPFFMTLSRTNPVDCGQISVSLEFETISMDGLLNSLQDEVAFS